MTVQQLSVFVENKQGSLSRITELLAAEKIDLRALSIADTQDFGILRLIVDNPGRACEILRNNGILVQITEVLGVKLPDRPGALSEVLGALDRAGINVEYLYAFLSQATPAGATGIMELLGREETLRRLQAAVSKLEGN